MRYVLIKMNKEFKKKIENRMKHIYFEKIDRTTCERITILSR